jgi:hypothetical protein
MAHVRVFFRLLITVILLTVPFGAIGRLVSGVPGARYGLAGALAVQFILFVISERGIARAARASVAAVPAGLHRSLEIVMEGEGGATPRFAVFEDPSPNAMVARSLGGTGLILVSRGLIALLNEHELRAVLSLCVKRTREPGIRFRSFCALLMVWMLALAPRPWVDLVFAGRPLARSEELRLSPVSAIAFLIFFPVSRFFLSAGRPVRQELDPDSYAGEAWSSAAHKISQSISMWGPTKSPGAFFLYLIDPGSRRMLLPS